MKRLALTLALASIIGAAWAQQVPADVPAGHWATKAVTDLYRLGLLKGYPDGLNRGTRPASRYEMAQAIQGLVAEQNRSFQALQSQIVELKDRISRTEPPAQQSIEGLAEIRRRLDVAEADTRVIASYRGDIDDLTSQFDSLLQRIRELRKSVQDARTAAKRG